jgi:hypothetical protein
MNIIVSGVVGIVLHCGRKPLQCIIVVFFAYHHESHGILKRRLLWLSNNRFIQDPLSFLILALHTIQIGEINCRRSKRRIDHNCRFKFIHGVMEAA